MYRSPWVGIVKLLTGFSRRLSSSGSLHNTIVVREQQVSSNIFLRNRLIRQEYVVPEIDLYGPFLYYLGLKLKKSEKK